MADKLNIPVDLTNLNSAFDEIIRRLGAVEQAFVVKAQRIRTEMQKVFQEGLAAQGITTGKFGTRKSFIEEYQGVDVVIGMDLVADFVKALEENLKDMQSRIKRARRTRTPRDLERAVKEQEQVAEEMERSAATLGTSKQLARSARERVAQLERQLETAKARALEQEYKDLQSAIKQQTGKSASSLRKGVTEQQAFVEALEAESQRGAVSPSLLRSAREKLTSLKAQLQQAEVKELTEQYRQLQNELRITRNQSSVRGLRAAILEQKKYIADLSSVVAQGALPVEMLQSAQLELQGLRRSLRAAKYHEQKRAERAQYTAVTSEQAEIRLSRRLETQRGIERAIKEQADFIARLEELVKSGQIGKKPLLTARRDLKSLEERAAQHAELRESLAREQTGIRLSRSFNTSAETQKAIAAQADFVAKLTVLKERGMVSARALQAAHRELKNVEDKAAERARSRWSEWAKDFSQKLREKADFSGIPGIQETIARQGQFVTRLRKLYNEGMLPRSVLRSEQARMRGLRRRLEEAKQEALSPRARRVMKERGWTPEQRAAARLKRRDKARARLQARKRDATKRISQGTMGAASVGIGVFGQAGFPLLNVAFASMSGLPYAGLAAVATAAGEAARALQALRASTMSTAEHLNFVTEGYKSITAEFEATKAVFGGLNQIAEERMLRERNQFAQNPMHIPLTMFWSAAQARFRNLLLPPQNFSEAAETARNILVPGRVNRFLNRVLLDTLQDLKNAPTALKEARTSMWRRLNEFTARIESGDEMWRRIQQAAASTHGDEQRRLAMKQIETIDKMIAAVEKWARVAEKMYETLKFLYDMRNPINWFSFGA